MSMDYSVKAITNQPLTEETLLNIVNNAKEVGFTDITTFSTDLNMFNKVKLDETLAKQMWLKYEKAGTTGISFNFCNIEKEIAADFSMSLTKINNNLVEIKLFQLGGTTRAGWECTLGIDFGWYVKKLLELSNPLPIIRLRTEIGFEGMYENQHVDFWIVCNSATYLKDGWRESKYVILSNGIPDYEKTFFSTLQQNAKTHHYELAIPEITDNFLTQEKILSGTAKWGKFSLKISKYKSYSVIIDDLQKCENLRTPLQLLVDLTEDMDAHDFYADNGKNPDLPR